MCAEASTADIPVEGHEGISVEFLQLGDKLSEEGRSLGSDTWCCLGAHLGEDVLDRLAALGELLRSLLVVKHDGDLRGDWTCS